jgi:hypothetical protein
MNELLDAFNTLQQQFPNDRLWLLGEEEPELDPLDEAHQQLLHNHPAVKCWGFQKIYGLTWRQPMYWFFQVTGRLSQCTFAGRIHGLYVDIC